MVKAYGWGKGGGEEREGSEEGGKGGEGGVGEVEPKNLFSCDYCLLTPTPNSYTTHSPFSGGSAALEPHFLLQHKPGRVKACFSSHAKLLCHHRKHFPYD